MSNRIGGGFDFLFAAFCVLALWALLSVSACAVALIEG